MSINDTIEGAVNEYSDYVIDRELSYDQQVELASYLKLLRRMAGKERIAMTAIVTEYPKALAAYDEMAVVNQKMESYFKEKNSRLFDEIEESIFNLPKERLMHPIDTKTQDTYAAYCENVYKFVLIGAALGKLNLLSVQEIKNIVSDKVKEDIEALRGRTDISKNLFGYVQQIWPDSPNSVYLNPNLLLELCAQKNGLEIRKISMLAAKIEQKENEIAKINGTIVKNKKKRHLYFAKIAFFTLANVATLVAPLPFIIKFGKAITQTSIELMVDDVKTETDSGKTLRTESFKASDLNFEYEIKRGGFTKKLLDTTHRYAVKFFDTEGDKVRVQVYDYTDSAMSDEELKTNDLDMTKLIYDKQLSVKKLKKSENDGQSKVFGSYTGKAHIDISRVNYSTEEVYELDDILLSICRIYPLALLFLAPVIMPVIMAIHEDFGAKNGEKIDKIIEEYKRTGEIGAEARAELEKMLDELKKLKEQQTLKNTMKRVAKEPTVDSELRNYGAGKRRTS